MARNTFALILYFRIVVHKAACHNLMGIGRFRIFRGGGGGGGTIS